MLRKEALHPVGCSAGRRAGGRAHLRTAQGSRAQSRHLPPVWPPWEHLLVNADHLRLLSFGAVETHQCPVDLKALGPFRTEALLSSAATFLRVNKSSYIQRDYIMLS